MKIAITGHRPNKLGNDYDLKSPLIISIAENIIEIVRQLGNEYPEEQRTMKNFTFITGMALGIDTLFAQIAVKFSIPYIAAIPFKGQEGRWPRRSQGVYYYYLGRAKQIYIVDEQRYTDIKEFIGYDINPARYRPEKMQLRNEWMVNNCDELIAVWDGTIGGTKNCIDYAISKNKSITYINPKSFITSKLL